MTERIELAITLDTRTAAFVSKRWTAVPSESEGLSVEQQDEFMDDLIMLMEDGQQGQRPEVSGLVSPQTAWIIRDMLDRCIATIDANPQVPSDVAATFPSIRAWAGADFTRLSAQIHDWAKSVTQPAPQSTPPSNFWAQVPDPIDPEQAKNLETLRFALAANAQAIDQARASCERAMVTQAIGAVVEDGRFGTDVDVEASSSPQRRSVLRVRATTLGILQNIYTSLRERSELPLQELARIEYLLTDAVEVRGVGSDVFYDVQVDGATAGLVHFILGDFLATDPVSQVPRKERRELRHWLRGMEADRTELWGVYFNSLNGPGGRSGARGFLRRR